VSADALSSAFDGLAADCQKALGDEVQTKRLVGMRFRQQVHQIEVDMPNRPLTDADIDESVNRFEEQYERIYGRGTALRNSGVEFISIRVEGIRPLEIPSLSAEKSTSTAIKSVATRKVYFYREGFHDLPVYRWDDLSVGSQIQGPAVVERADTTIVVGLNQRAEIEPFGNMIIEQQLRANEQ